ncbi:MAG TPA: DNA replication protein DnaD, partial [Clostridiaceae bacterium]|nr:DNA replication protein DnaD [Clostridiaceae bacterium]
MAVYRQVHTTFWTDPDILEWSPEEKYFYLYLMTNPYTNQTGIYEISKKMMSMQLGYPIDTVSIHIQSLIKRSKIRYSDDTKEVYLINWIKYNKSTSPKVITLIDKELETVKNQSFANDYHQRCCLMGIKLKPLSIQYPYSIHTHPQKEQEQEQEQE